MTDRHPAPQPGAADPVRRVRGVARAVTGAAPGAARAAAWDLRAVRAVPFALVCTVIAAAGHDLGGGGPVDPSTLALGFALVCALAALLGGRERSLTSIAGALGTGQLGLHLLFHCVGHHAMSGMTMDQVAGRLICNDMPGSLMGTLPVGMTPAQLLGDAGLDPSAYHTAAVLPWWQFGLTPAMAAGHLAAAVLAGWWLSRGEAALWRLVRLAGALAREVQDRAAPLRTALLLVAALLRGLLGTAGTDVRAVRPDAGSGRLPRAAVLRHSVIRRGPPVAAFAH
ncbi:hypothetical protein P3T37_006814 [Kitasatospora sp. MAA4]|uniref:hypothetical protein n=1 Tax=Kitasatospora sp. MAA4 TaxID=3035093 RepID=UPI0024765ED9|nr:hypothetical protein [Kitasatospora sp. MAA4]MDH6137382.1 hypothetical protein [Kitasatospora sp. MAA4]